MSSWSLVYDRFDPAQEGHREALCALGNGYFVTRGAAAENDADDVHYPGTYLAGGYNRLTTDIAGHTIENEDLVNFPNWLPLTFRIEGGNWFNPLAVELLSYRQELDMSAGVLLRAIRFRDRQGRISAVRHRRLVHMRQPHLAALETTLEAENWSGAVEFRTALDGRVVNAGVKRYQHLNNKHLKPLKAEAIDGESLFLQVETNQSGIRIAQAARTRVFSGGALIEPQRRTVAEPGYIAHEFTVEVRPGTEVRVEKLLALFTSRDKAISECGLEARKWVARSGGFNDLLGGHSLAWKLLWNRFNIGISARRPESGRASASAAGATAAPTADWQTPGAAGAPRADEGAGLSSDTEGESRAALILRLHLFHLLQTASMHTMDLHAGVPARGWHGEAYRGHIFWDELFIFPLLNLRVPQITRSLLMHRYERLNEARANARAAGYRGAMYPWQSGSDGREESQRIHLNPKSGRWVPDHSYRQRHVNAAIAYNIWQYHQVTADTEFLSMYGAEMLLEIARFWASISTYNTALKRYEIPGVMGPDEYHDGYPGAAGGGLNNNSYTNIMAVWVISRALELLNTLSSDRSAELSEALALTGEEINRWRDITRNMRVVFHADGIISQFEGYEQLEELDWERYRRKYGNIARLDRILEAEGDTPNRYKASKQADVLMLFYLFSAEELAQLFEQLGYPFDPATIPKNIDYYLKRTSHGSTLSAVVHSWVLARSDRAGSWQLFADALKSDVSDVQGGTTAEGIHLGAMAGTVDLVQRGHTGIVAHEDVLWFNPCLPEEWARLRIRLRYRRQSLEVEIGGGKLTVHSIAGREKAIRVGYRGRVHELAGGETAEFTLAGSICSEG